MITPRARRGRCEGTIAPDRACDPLCGPDQYSQRMPAAPSHPLTAVWWGRNCVTRTGGVLRADGASACSTGTCWL
jgi:hypothetical protein